MRVTIYQPRYFPQLHYFNRMINSNVFVFLDDAQFTKSLKQKGLQKEKRVVSFQADSPIKGSSGIQLLTVPVIHEGYMPLNKTKIDYLQRWSKKHLSIIKSAYQNSKNYLDIHDSIKKILSLNYLSLASLNIVTTLWALSYIYDFNLDLSSLNFKNINSNLEIQEKIKLKKIILSSSLGVERPEGLQKGSEWTTAICERLGATEYFYGGTAKSNYMRLDFYKSHGIKPVMQEWNCGEYQQQFSKKISFIPNLSILDLLFNMDKEKTQNIIA